MKHRHWLRGIIGGILLGLGLAIGTIVYAINPVGAMTPWAALVVGILIGILLVLVPSPRKGRRKPPPGYPTAYPPR